MSSRSPSWRPGGMTDPCQLPGGMADLSQPACGMANLCQLAVPWPISASWPCHGRPLPAGRVMADLCQLAVSWPTSAGWPFHGRPLTAGLAEVCQLAWLGSASRPGRGPPAGLAEVRQLAWPRPASWPWRPCALGRWDLSCTMGQAPRVSGQILCLNDTLGGHAPFDAKIATARRVKHREWPRQSL